MKMKVKGKLKFLYPPNASVQILFMCPGCKEPHNLNDTWQWNGDAKRPTFMPSVLVQKGHYASGHDDGPCWCTYNEQHPNNPSRFSCGICHSYVTDGKIQFLADSTHELRGQTVDLPEWEA